MFVNDLLNMLLFYIFTVVFFYSCVASFSYAFYVRKTSASSELQNLFQANLKPPFKWMFLGKKPFFERILLSTAPQYKDFEDYIESIPLPQIYFYRISCSVVSLLPMLIIFVFFVVPQKELIGQFMIDLIIHVLTLVVSLRFGHKLSSLKNEIIQ